MTGAHEVAGRDIQNDHRDPDRNHPTQEPPAMNEIPEQKGQHASSEQRGNQFHDGDTPGDHMSYPAPPPARHAQCYADPKHPTQRPLTDPRAGSA